MGKFFVVLGLCLVTLTSVSVAQEDADPNVEIDRLRKIIMEEQQVIAECMKRIDKLEASDKETEKRLEKSPLSSIIKLKGDFRYRYELIDVDPQKFNTSVKSRFFGAEEDQTRDRHRLRLRVGAEWKANDEWTVGAQLATTMDGDPVSTNQTLTDSFSKKDIWVDKAYFDYHPEAWKGFKLIGGKMGNPFYSTSSLVWDGDLTPEGLAATYATESGPWAWGVNTGWFQIEERSRDEDSQLYGLQGLATYKFMDGDASLTAGLSYYDFIDTEDYPTFVSASNNFGNSLSLAILNGLGVGYYADDYNLVNAFVEAAFPLGSLPCAVYADYVVNTSASDRYFDREDGDTGWAAGLVLGKCSDPGSWSLKYEYRDVERDAVVGAFSDSDFGGGGTNSHGHIVGAEYGLFKNVKLAATYFNVENEGSQWLRFMPTYGGSQKYEANYQRLQLDVNVKF